MLEVGQSHSKVLTNFCLDCERILFIQNAKFVALFDGVLLFVIPILLRL